MASKNIITPWSFRDGRDYIISLSVSDNSSSFSIKVTDRITAEEWTCSYDIKYIENLTQRTGSYKPFNVFISMIKSAILKKSESVALEMMNFEDLEGLRIQRGQSTPSIMNSGHKDNNSKLFNHHHSDSPLPPAKEPGEKSQNENTRKRYLIVTYVAEFDRVHYPIPLIYSGPPNPMIMQESIKKLRSEVSSLRNAKNALEEEVIQLKQGLRSHTPAASTANSELTDINNNSFPSHNNNKYRTCQEEAMAGVVDIKQSKYRQPEDHSRDSRLHHLQMRVNELEEQIFSERADHHQRIEKLQAENDFLCQKLEEAQKREKYEFRQQANGFHSKQRRNVREVDEFNNHNDISSRNGHHHRSNLNLNVQFRKCKYQDLTRTAKNDYLSSGGNAANNSRGRIRCGGSERCRSNSRSRQCLNNVGMMMMERQSRKTNYQKSVNISPLKRHLHDGGTNLRARLSDREKSLSRSRSLSPCKPPFNPTAYINEKKLKQERMSKLRLDNIRARLRDSSSGSQNRSRSNSRERVACSAPS